MTRNPVPTWISLSLLVACVSLFGCGGDDGPANPGTGGGANSGVFLDSAVEGLGFTAGAQSGVTDAAGTFGFDSGSDATFAVGGITIGAGTAASAMTPLSLVPGAFNETNSTVTNIARFLQTIDDDANPSNGIRIVEAVRTAAAGLSLDFAQDPADFESDPATQAAVASLTSQTTAGTRSLVDPATAQAHLRGTLLASRAADYSGIYEAFGEGENTPQIGTWSFNVGSDGGVSGTGRISGVDVTISGTLTSDGVLNGTQPPPDSYTYYIQIALDGSVSGMWYGPGEIGATMRGARN